MTDPSIPPGLPDDEVVLDDSWVSFFHDGPIEDGQQGDPILSEQVALLTAVNLIVESVPGWGTAEQRAALGTVSRGIRDLGGCRMRLAASRQPMTPPTTPPATPAGGAAWVGMQALIVNDLCYWSRLEGTIVAFMAGIDGHSDLYRVEFPDFTATVFEAWEMEVWG